MGLYTLCRIRFGESGIAVGAPLHGRPHAIPVAEIDVVPHSDFVTVINDWRAGERKQKAVQEFDAAPIVFHQRSKTSANAYIDFHFRIRTVGEVHVIPFVCRNHLEGQFIMIAQKQSPLAVRWNFRRLPHDVGDGMPVFHAERHEDSRHDWKMECHVTFVPVPEIRTNIGRPLIGLGKHHAVFVTIQLPADGFDQNVRFGQVFAVGAIPLDKIWNRIQPQSVDSHIEPELHGPDHMFENGGIVEVQIGLMRVEAMPVVGVGHGIPCPV